VTVGIGAHPRGFPNATSIAALVNGGWLLILELLVASAAVARLITGAPQVDGLPVLVVSGIAALVMAAGTLILRGNADDDEGETGQRDLSIAAVLLDTIADAAAAAGVPRRVRSSWQQGGGTGWTLRWRSLSPWSSPITPSH